MLQTLVLMMLPLLRTKKVAVSSVPTSVSLLKTTKRISKLRRKLASSDSRSKLSSRL